jgi:hypothetical protein
MSSLSLWSLSEGQVGEAWEPYNERMLFLPPHNSSLSLFSMTFHFHLLFYSTLHPSLTLSCRSVSLEAKSRSATQDFLNTLRNPNVHYRVHMTPPMVSILSQISPICTPSYFSKTSFNILYRLHPVVYKILDYIYIFEAWWWLKLWSKHVAILINKSKLFVNQVLCWRL